MEPSAILQPAVALGLWSGVVMLWLARARLKAAPTTRIPKAEQAHPSGMAYFPTEARRVADNYNHLFEQPTLFYAVVLLIAALGHVDALAVACAWGFVALRVVHSLVQATVNIVLLRFGIFMLSWALLPVLLVREAVALF